MFIIEVTEIGPLIYFTNNYTIDYFNNNSS